jgi:hypothetical protein
MYENSRYYIPTWRVNCEQEAVRSGDNKRIIQFFKDQFESLLVGEHLFIFQEEKVCMPAGLVDSQ